MKYLFCLLFLLPAMNPPIILFDFTNTASLENWRVVDDGVMGGKSAGNLTVNDKGQGVFEGDISLENYGGFSSVRFYFDAVHIEDRTKVILKVKGDGKDYQFRVKAATGDYYTYVSKFSTNGKWQEIEIELKDMYPSFRGRKLNVPNFDKDAIESITLLIGNKKAEHFRLLIDQITLQ